MSNRIIGVPYAYGRVIGRKVYRECPVCHDQILDQPGTFAYANHYQELHERDEDEQEQ